eukprot:Gb_03037 [translate_table: standard]
MDTHSLAVELAPAIVWQTDGRKSNFLGQQPLLSHAGRLLGLRSSSQDSARRSIGTWTGGHTFSTDNGNTIYENGYDEWHDLSDDGDSPHGGLDIASQIPLDDGTPPVDFAVVEFVQCLIEHHNTIFTDASETIWQ